MIEVRPHGKYKRGFVVQGHADFAPHGQDILCAAVSAIAQMIAREINRLRVGTQEIRSGYLSVQNHVDGYTSDLIEMMVRTLKDIERQYPDHLKVYQEESLDDTYTWV